MKKSNSVSNIKNLTLLALMTALVVVFQTIGLIIPIGFNVAAFALVPIVIGAAMLGPLAGAWLGLVFGIVILSTGGAAAFFPMGVIPTVILVLLKGTIAGWVSGLVYKLIEKKNSLVAIIAASVLCPVINTGIFTLGCFTVFHSGITSGMLTGNTPVSDLVPFVFLTLIGINFFVELGICLVFSSVFERIITIGKKMRHDKSYI